MNRSTKDKRAIWVFVIIIAIVMGIVLYGYLTGA
jgi:hypothetical protein